MITITISTPPCAGHRLLIADDGHIALADHDIRAERAVVALGGDASPCYYAMHCIIHGYAAYAIVHGLEAYGVAVEIGRKRSARDGRRRSPAPTRWRMARAFLERALTASITRWIRTRHISGDVDVLIVSDYTPTLFSDNRRVMNGRRVHHIQLMINLATAVRWWRASTSAARWLGITYDRRRDRILVSDKRIHDVTVYKRRSDQ